MSKLFVLSTNITIFFFFSNFPTPDCDPPSN